MKSSLLPLLSHVFLLFVSPAVAAGGLAERQSCTDSTAIYCSSSTGSSIGGSSSNSSSSNSSSSSGGSSSGGSSSGGGYSSPDWIGNGALLTGLYNGEGYIKKRSDPGLQRRQDALCCPANSQCDVLGDNNTPVCYDPETTAFAFSDGSYGVVKTGMFYDADGSVLDLNTGDYTLATGAVGNYYVDHGETPPAAAKNTAKSNGATTTPNAARSGVRMPSSSHEILLLLGVTVLGFVF